MKKYTVQIGFFDHNAGRLGVEADSVEEACRKAVDGDQDVNWKRTDHASRTFVDAIAEGEDADPWAEDNKLAVPYRFTDAGTYADERGHVADPDAPRPNHRAVGSIPWFVVVGGAEPMVFGPYATEAEGEAFCDGARQAFGGVSDTEFDIVQAADPEAAKAAVAPAAGQPS